MELTLNTITSRECYFISKVILFKNFSFILFFKIGKLHEGLLCFEQCIKFNSCDAAVAKAIFEISKIKIEMRDFYSAFYTLNRFDYLNLTTNKSSLEKFKIFIESVQFIINFLIYLFKQKI